MDRRGDVFLAALADDHKRIEAGIWSVEHGNVIGEYKAKCSTELRDTPEPYKGACVAQSNS